MCVLGVGERDSVMTSPSFPTGSSCVITVEILNETVIHLFTDGESGGNREKKERERKTKVKRVEDNNQNNNSCMY